MRRITSLLLTLLLLGILKLSLLDSYQMNNYYYGVLQSNDLSSNVDKKYVNSGQSIILVCDLPTNMPDGPVSLFS